MFLALPGTTAAHQSGPEARQTVPTALGPATWLRAPAGPSGGVCGLIPSARFYFLLPNLCAPPPRPPSGRGQASPLTSAPEAKSADARPVLRLGGQPSPRGAAPSQAPPSARGAPPGFRAELDVGLFLKNLTRPQVSQTYFLRLLK